AQLVAVGNPEHHWSRTGHLAEALFTFAQQPFRTPPFRPIDEQPQNEDSLAERDRRNRENWPSVSFPQSEFTKSHGATGWQTVLPADPPAQLAPVELGSECLMYAGAEPLTAHDAKGDCGHVAAQHAV